MGRNGRIHPFSNRDSDVHDLSGVLRPPPGPGVAGAFWRLLGRFFAFVKALPVHHRSSNVVMDNPSFDMF